MFQTGWGWVTYVKCQFYGHQIIRTSIFHNHGIEWRYSICRQPNAQNRQNDPPLDISICCDVVAKASFSCNITSARTVEMSQRNHCGFMWGWVKTHVAFVDVHPPETKYIDQYSSHMFLSLLDLVPVNRISPAV